MQYGEFDETHYPRNAPSELETLLNSGISRRALFRAGLGTAAFILNTGCNGGSPLASSAQQNTNVPLMSFDAIGSSVADTITLPDGYTWSPLISWGDPISASVNPFSHPDALTSTDQALALGDNNDGMTLFSVDEDSAVLAVNNEYINRWNFYQDTGNPSAEEVTKAQVAHGVTVMNITRVDGQWRVLLDGPQTRRITAKTPIALSGPEPLSP